LAIQVAQTLPIDCFACGLAISEGALWVTDGNLILRYGLVGTGPVAEIRDPVGISTLDDNITVGEGAVWVIDDAGLVRIDPKRNRISARIGLLGKQALIVDAGGIAAGVGAVWVTNPLAGTVSRVDPATNRVVQRIRVGRNPLGVSVGEGAVWVVNRGDGTVSRIDPAAGMVVETIPVGPNPTRVAAGVDGVWVTVDV
jgi:YVTN family beta-propeller protein